MYDENGLCPTLCSGPHGYAMGFIATKQMLKIRKLTPKECWRLMGFTDLQFEKSNRFMTETALYKQAGNSIVINVLEEIFKPLFY